MVLNPSKLDWAEVKQEAEKNNLSRFSLYRRDIWSNGNENSWREIIVMK